VIALRPDPVCRQLTPSDIARWSEELVAAERESRQFWDALADKDKAGIVCRIREELLRLLLDPSWLPGRLRFGGGNRLDVTISLDLGWEEAAADTVQLFLSERDLLDTLTGLAARLNP
jgi:hypothetical protein